MLDMHLTLLSVTVVLFLILLVVLNKILYKPLLEFIDNRNALLKKDLDNAAKNSDDVAAYYQEANKIILEAKNRVAVNRAELLAKARAQNEQQIEEKKAKLEVEYDKFIKTLEAEKSELKNTLTGQLPLYKEALKAKLSQI